MLAKPRDDGGISRHRYLCGVLEPAYQWHEQAVALFGGTKPRWCTSFLVVSEGYSWLLYRMGEEAARTYGRLLDNLDGLRVFEATSEHHQNVVMNQRLKRVGL